MTPRERVHAALSKQPVDRVPIFMWFHPSTRRRLARRLEVPPGLVDEVMGNDVKQTWVNNNYAMEGVVHEREGESHVDRWGIRWVREGEFNQIAAFPLAGAGRDDVLAYPFPYDHVDDLLALMEPVAAHAERFFIGCDVSPCVFEMYWRLRGMETALLEMAARADLAGEMFRRCADFSIALSRSALATWRLDWLWAGDDVAAQRGMLMSPSAWRDQIKPHLARVFEVGKSAGVWVAFHCCGALRPIVPDLIELGLDVLNPIQCNCPGMDPLELKRQFGGELAFMGGVDTQGVLPNGSPDDVRRATARLLEGMTADGGGYILAASHTIPPETPDANLFALYEAAGLSAEQIFDAAADARARMPRPGEEGSTPL